MKQFEFLEGYGEHKKGDVIPMDKTIYHKFIHPLLKKGVLKVIRSDEKIKEAVKEVVNKPTDEEIDLRKGLRLLKMGRLRALGSPYGAKDTSKEELIQEILQMVPDEKIKNFLDGDE